MEKLASTVQSQIIKSYNVSCPQRRASGTEPPGRWEGQARSGAPPWLRGLFLLENDFNACYDATLICLCAQKGADGGGGGEG